MGIRFVEEQSWSSIIHAGERSSQGEQPVKVEDELICTCHMGMIQKYHAPKKLRTRDVRLAPGN